MYKFQKILLENNIILAIKVESSDLLINFCTIVRALFLWKNQQTVGKLPYNAEEINKIKEIYQDSLELYQFLNLLNRSKKTRIEKMKLR
ncbi:hypothetical protein WMO40_12915 [Bacillaceae bacterium CLA-AA-H227]|uniref:Uncharacterized protein n=1 Tax=Robertmurraya yapensis (ex Hitch et al 2024) TaxID=3133160 RepID=A0ACC6SCC0_9BACI